MAAVKVRLWARFNRALGGGYRAHAPLHCFDVLDVQEHIIYPAQLYFLSRHISACRAWAILACLKGLGVGDAHTNMPNAVLEFVHYTPPVSD